ncbi:MAG: putative phage repressor, partial [Tardiphaga sp.]|nr:putative phage repressor [Tardiphaga sp.]
MEPREIIREARERRSWSQKDLADRAGVSQVAIVKIESGATVQSKFLPRIAQILGLDLAELDPSLKGVTLPAQDRPFLNDIRPDFRVYASAEGGPGEIIRSSEPI